MRLEDRGFIGDFKVPCAVTLKPKGWASLSPTSSLLCSLLTSTINDVFFSFTKMIRPKM